MSYLQFEVSHLALLFTIKDNYYYQWLYFCLNTVSTIKAVLFWLVRLSLLLLKTQVSVEVAFPRSRGDLNLVVAALRGRPSE